MNINSKKGIAVQIMIYNDKRKLVRVIFSPVIKNAIELLEIKNEESLNRVKEIISKQRGELFSMTPIFISNDMMYIKIFNICKIIWYEQQVLAEENYRKIKEERERVFNLTKIEKEEKKRQAAIEKERKDQMKKNKKKGRRAIKKNHYVATFVYKEGGEVYEEYEGSTQKMIAYRTGIAKNKVKDFYNQFVWLKTNKIKHIHKAIEEHGLLLKIDVTRGSYEDIQETP